MEATNGQKVAKTSRAAIDSLENSKEEFKAMIDRMDTEVENLSQQVRLTNNSDGAGPVDYINKLKLHRRQLQVILTEMDAIGEDNPARWDELRPAASQAYEDATAIRQ